MSFFGIRCSSNDFSYVILSGSKKTPNIIQKGICSFPSGYSRPQSLKWFSHEIEDLIRKNPGIKVICVKGAEPLARKAGAFVCRVENEAIVFLVAANHGIKAIFRKTKPTIAKDLGVKGKSRYLETLDYSVFSEYDKEKVKTQEAILAAWSCML